MRSRAARTGPGLVASSDAFSLERDKPESPDQSLVDHELPAGSLFASPMKTGGWLGKLALVMLSLVVTVVLLNLAIVFGMYITHNDLMYRYDPLLGWRVLPNLR